ncbi:MAG: hypothetical protein QOF72_2233 [Blastocatellia bacterium]|nr:hypothetical protein [Blastocatellia bacterium]
MVVERFWCSWQIKHSPPVFEFDDVPLVLLELICVAVASSAAGDSAVPESDAAALTPWWWVNSTVLPQASEASSIRASKRALLAGLRKSIWAGLLITVL